MQKNHACVQVTMHSLLHKVSLIQKEKQSIKTEIRCKANSVKTVGQSSTPVAPLSICTHTHSVESVS